ncbi:hypothetical protein DFA_06838 [Cavenderia fasciculata]|uniref:ComC supersandwich domain-containing protein n=1 Tax=Cavenderia fasciculata TaxID=261658 RepID=F4Q2F1_CACFS|nr:uncharacterized protein DFA_06838 [Cavenderia fasciculata]EGG18171.1 hypothetical protein DFA_06838 [Cavenderia fasciculata]|eukprot:XP_004366212.1 hypothetical protein DFA_06838 [Cavenderia fasciculata]
MAAIYHLHQHYLLRDTLSGQVNYSYTASPRVSSGSNALFINMLVYNPADCPMNQSPTGKPEKVVSFLPGQCYNYPNHTSVAMYIVNSLLFSYNEYASWNCLNLVTTFQFTYNPGPPQLPITNSPPYLYYENIPSTFSNGDPTCGSILNDNGSFGVSRTVVLPNTCTFGDTEYTSLLSGDGTLSSIQLAYNASQCMMSKSTTWTVACPVDTPEPVKILSAFKGNATVPLPVPAIPNVIVLGYDAIRLQFIDFVFPYQQQSTQYIAVAMQDINGTFFNTNYVYKLDQNVTITGLNANFTGRCLISAHGSDHVNGLIGPSTNTANFNIPAYPKIATIKRSVTTTTMNLTYTTVGGFDNLNVYQIVTSITPSTTTTHYQCNYTTTCVIGGFPPGSIVSLTVGVTNFGKTNLFGPYPVELLLPIANLTMTGQAVSGGISYHYTVAGMGSGPTTYSLNVHNHLLLNTTTYTALPFTNSITVRLYQPGNYTILGFAENDGTRLEVGPTTIYYQGDLKIEKVIFVKVGIDIFIGSIFASNVHNMSNVKVMIQPFNEWISPSFSIQPLQPATQYNWTVQIFEDLRISNTMPFSFTTYPLVSLLSPRATQRKDSYGTATLQIEAFSEGGIPNSSFYFFTTEFPYSSSINKNNTIIGYNLTYPSGPYQVPIKVVNDVSIDTRVYNFKLYNFPLIDNVIVNSDYETIDLKWSGSGGMPGNILYTVTVFNPNQGGGGGASGVQWCRSPNITECLVTGLTSNTFYGFNITMYSTQFDPFTFTLFNSTLTYPNSLTCIDMNGVNNTIDCNGFGQCLNGTCLCDKNRIGIYCQNQTTDQGGNSGNGTNVDPNPSKPEIIINNKNIFYEFVISQIREVDIGDNVVKMVDLTTLNWTLSNQTSIYNTSFIQSNWIYMTSNNSYFNSVNITFLQFKSTSDSQSQSKIPLTFAGQLFYLDVGSMKYTIDIDGWEFDITNSTEFTSVYVGEDQFVVGKLINRALLDELPRKISYKVQLSTDNNNNNNSTTPKQILSIITLIPNFNYKATLDPQFDLLINSDPEGDCSPKSNTWKIIVGVVIGGVVAIAIATTSIILFKKKSDRDRMIISSRFSHYTVIVAIIQIVFIILCSFNSVVMAAGPLVETPKILLSNYTFANLKVYSSSGCALSQVPTDKPEKVVSFMPNYCYPYDQNSLRISLISPTALSHGLHALDTTCQSPAGPFIMFNPTQVTCSTRSTNAPNLNSCNADLPNVYVNSRNIVRTNICAADDYSLYAGFMTGSGTATSAQLSMTGTDQCTSTVFTNYPSGCPGFYDGYRISRAFRAGGPVPKIPIVTPVTYDTINITNIDFGYQTKSTDYVQFEFYVAINGSTYTHNPTYVYQIRDTVVLTGVPNNLQFKLTIKWMGYDYINNIAPTPIQSDFYTIPVYPTISSVNVVSKTTSTITISYSSIGGYTDTTGNTYTVTSTSPSTAMASYPECATTTTCVLKTNNPGSTITYSVLVNSRGYSSPANAATVNLLPQINFISGKALIVQNGVNITYRVGTGGYGPTTFNVTITNNQTSAVVSTFTNLPSSPGYLILPLVAIGTYRVDFVAMNDVIYLTTLIYFDWLGAITISSCVVEAIKTKTATLAIEAIGIYPTEGYQVNVYPSLESTLFDTYTTLTSIITLPNPPGSIQNIKVQIVQGDRRSAFSTLQFQSYVTISNLRFAPIQRRNESDQSQSILYISVQTDDGVPNDTKYYVQYSGFGNIMTNININYIVIDNVVISPNPSILNITIENDGTILSSIRNITIYEYPLINELNIQQGYENLYVTWNSSGGMPGSIQFQVSLDNADEQQSVVCVTNNSYCNITGLIPDSSYTVRLTMKSVQFDDIFKINQTQTLKYTENETCIDPKGVNLNVFCNGFGQCLNGTCLCVGNRVGIYCETEKNPGGGGNNGTNNGGNIEPNPTNPYIIIVEQDVSYQFTFWQIREVDLDDQIVKTLDLTAMNWTLDNQTNQDTPVSPSIILNQWKYNNNNSLEYFDKMGITFTQYQQRPGSTTNNTTDQPKIPVLFANQTFYIDVGSLKYTVNIEGWNFNSRLNTLQILTNITQPKSDSGCGDDESLENTVTNSAEYTSFYLGKKSAVLGKFINRALLDEIPRRIKFAIENSNNTQSDNRNTQTLTFVTLVPYFQYSATLDPDLQLLISPTQDEHCNSNSNTWRIAVGVVVGGVAAAAIVTTSIVLYKKKLIAKNLNKKFANKLKVFNENE